MGLSSSKPTLEAIQADKYGANNLFNKSKANDASAILGALNAFKQKCSSHKRGLTTMNDLLCMSIYAVQIDKLRSDMHAYKGNRTLDPSSKYVRAVSSASMQAAQLIEQFKVEKYEDAAQAPSFSVAAGDLRLDADIQAQIDLCHKKNYTAGSDSDYWISAYAETFRNETSTLIPQLNPSNARAMFAELKVYETLLNVERNFASKASTIQMIQAGQKTVVTLLNDMQVTKWA